MKDSILYIEDEFFFANTIANKLSEHGFEMDTAKNGTLGIEALKKKKYGLVLLDLILPEMSGFEVLEHMKQDPATKDIPVVVLSNLSSDEDREKAKALGASDFFVKINTTPNEVLAMVRRIVGSPADPTP